MKKIFKIIWILSFFLLWGCAKPVYVPVETKYMIEYRDSLVYVKDTITIEIPTEVIKEVKPIIEPSKLETKVAISEAYVDTLDMTLHHTLKNKPNFETAIDTVVIVKNKVEYLEKPILTEVEVPVPYIPKIFWIALWFSIGVIIFIAVKLYLKFKGGLF